MKNPDEQTLEGADLDIQDEVRLLANGTSISLAAHIIGRLVHVFTDILLARLFGPAFFGIYAIAWNLHRLLGILVNLGISNGVTFFGVQYWKRDAGELLGIYRAGLLITLLSSAVAALACGLGAEMIAVQVFQKPEAAPAIRTAGLATPLMMGMAVASALTRVTRRVQYAMFSVEIVVSLGMLGIFLAGYWMTGQETVVWVSMLAAYGLAMLSSLWFASRLFPEMKTARVPSLAHSMNTLLAYSLPTVVAGGFASVTLWGNRLVGGMLLPASEVGLYQAASQFNNLFGILLGSITAVFVPMIAGFYHQGQKEKLNELYKVTTKWALYINLPFALLALALPVEVMGGIYGPAYESGAILLVLLTISQLLNVATGASSAVLMMTRNQGLLLRLTFMVFLLNLTGSVILTGWLGVSGMALGMLFGSLLLNGYSVWWIGRTLGLWPYDWRFLKAGVASAVFLAVLLLTGWLHGPDLLMLGLRASLAGLAYLAALWLMRLDAEDYAFLAELKRMLASRLGLKRNP